MLVIFFSPLRMINEGCCLIIWFLPSSWWLTDCDWAMGEWMMVIVLLNCRVGSPMNEWWFYPYILPGHDNNELMVFIILSTDKSYQWMNDVIILSNCPVISIKMIFILLHCQVESTMNEWWLLSCHAARSYQ
jgi:hypothetical protein